MNEAAHSSCVRFSPPHFLPLAFILVIFLSLPTFNRFSWISESRCVFDPLYALVVACSVNFCVCLPWTWTLDSSRTVLYCEYSLSGSMISLAGSLTLIPYGTYSPCFGSRRTPRKASVLSMPSCFPLGWFCLFFPALLDPLSSKFFEAVISFLTRSCTRLSLFLRPSLRPALSEKPPLTSLWILLNKLILNKDQFYLPFGIRYFNWVLKILLHQEVVGMMG